MTGTRVAWLAIVVGPLAWLGCLELVYALASAHCDRWSGPALVGMVVTAALVAAGGALAGRRALAAAGPPADGGPGPRRLRFMGMLGILASLLFTLVLLAAAIPPAIVPPCG
jgi:hypothetical protein